METEHSVFSVSELANVHQSFVFRFKNCCDRCHGKNVHILYVYKDKYGRVQLPK